MDIIYTMPGQSHRMFVNVIHACPNSCFFCVDFKGDTFYGFDLKKGRRPTAQQIIDAVKAYPFRHSVREVYFCGIGEPLLQYDTVCETVEAIRGLFSPLATIAINTSGTFYAYHRRVDFARNFDLIQISLNAENEDKYNLICRPKIQGAYQVLMAFLCDLRTFLDRTGVPCKVELSVVDPSDVDSLPEHVTLSRDIPRPDIDACRKIAEQLGWPLKVKNLIRDCELGEWSEFASTIRCMEI